MTREKTTMMLSETLRISRDEAVAALEAQDWDVLLAAQLLQKKQRAEIAARRRSQPARGRLARFFGGV